MAFIQVSRTWKGESASADHEVWNYIVQSETAETSCTEAMNVTELGSMPEEGDVLPGTALRARKECKRRDNEPTIFDVTVNWELPNSGGGGSVEVKPEVASGDTAYWNVEVSSKGASYQEEVFTNRDDEPIQSTSRGRLPNGTLKTYEDELFTISFNTNSLDIAAIDLARGCVNANEITLTVKGVTKVFPTETLKLVDAPWSFTYEWTNDPSKPDFKAQIDLHYRPEGWTVYKLDEDLCELSSTDERVPILDGKGDPITTPQPLDGSGFQLTAGGDLVLLPFDIDDPADFSFLESIGSGS